MLSSFRKRSARDSSADDADENTPLTDKEWVSPFAVLIFLSSIFFLIYIDRGTIASTPVNGNESDDDDPDGSGIQGEFDLSNTEDGLLSSMFMVGMVIAIPIFSEAIYHYNAFRLVGISLLIWSLATIGCGLSFGFYSIAFCRMFVGVGEAAVISLAPPYIDDHAPPKRKTLWLACLFFAVPAGFSAGYGYGALMQSTFGWRSAFVLEGILMCPFVLFCFLAKPLHLNMKTAHGRQDEVLLRNENRFQTFWRHSREIWSHRVYGYILGGYITYIAFIGVVAYWGAKAAKAVYDLPDMVTGAIAVVMGSSGTVIGGLVLDKIGSTIPRALFLSAVCALAPGLMMTVGFILKPALGVFIVVYSIALIFLFSLQAPVQAAVLWCVPPNHRTLANGLSVLTIHLFGDVPSPPIFGALLDYFKHTKQQDEDDAYRNALSIFSMILILSGTLFIISAQIGRSAKDYRVITEAREDDSSPSQQETNQLESQVLL